MDLKKQVIVEVLLAEYRVLREEISLYHSQQKQIMGFAFIMTGAVISAEYTDGLGSKSTWLWLLVPYISLLLCCLYCDRTVRVLRIAHYIDNFLRLRIEGVLEEEIWGWEDYKRNRDFFNRRIAILLDRSRWIVFIGPGLVMFLRYSGKYWDAFRAGSDPFEVVMFVGAILALVACFFVMSIAEETKGVALEDHSDEVTSPEDDDADLGDA